MTTFAPKHDDPRTRIPLARYLGLRGEQPHGWWLWEGLAVLLMIVLLTVAARAC